MPTTLKTYGGAIKKKKRKLLPRAIRLHVGQQPSPHTVFEALRSDNIRKCKNEYKNSKKENHNHCGMVHSKRKMSPDKFVPVGDSTVFFKSPELNSTFDKLCKGPVLQPIKPNRLPNTHGSLSSGSSSENYNFSSSYSVPSSDSPSFLGFPDGISTARPPRPFTRLEYTPKKTYQPQTPKSMKRKRCTRLVIAGKDSSQNLSRQSIFKDVCCSFNGTFARSSINEEGTILKLEPTLSNASLNLLDSPTQCEEVLHSACDVVLSKCHLKRILLFSDVFSFSFLDKCSKIGEGVYGEVFSCEESCSVIKIIPIEGNQLVNGEPQKTFKEILSEIVITIELSNLRCSQYNTTSAFTEVLRCLCVQGRYPHRLIELWNIYAENKGTENDSPEMFAEDQLFIILELSHGGTDLEAYHFQSAEQAFSVYQQVAHALAVAECSLEFEHRDLHWGNILISPTRDTISRFCIRGKQIDVATKGVKVTIIDFTLSRMTYEDCHIFNDLSVEESLFTAHGDYQFEMYRLMRSAVKDDWSTFVPKTNVFWLHYLLDKMCTLVHYKRKNTKVHKEYIKRAQDLFKSILRFDSVTQSVNSVEC